jgi:hypothetical protein
MLTISFLKILFFLGFLFLLFGDFKILYSNLNELKSLLSKYSKKKS